MKPKSTALSVTLAILAVGAFIALGAWISTIPQTGKTDLLAESDTVERAPVESENKVLSQDVGITPNMQNEKVHIEPSTIEREVQKSAFIAEATLIEYGAGTFNTASGLPPTSTVSADPMIDPPAEWALFTNAVFEVDEVLLGSVTTTHVVAPLRGGDSGTGFTHHVEGVNWQNYQVGQQMIIFSHEEHIPAQYVDLHWLTRGSDKYQDLVNLGESPAFLAIGESCIYNGTQAECQENATALAITSLKSQIQTVLLTPTPTLTPFPTLTPSPTP